MKINRKILEDHLQNTIVFAIFILIASLYKFVSPQGQKSYLNLLLIITFPVILFSTIFESRKLYFENFDDAIRMGITRNVLNRTNTVLILLNSSLFAILNVIIVFALKDFGLIDISINLFEVTKVFLTYVGIYSIVHLVLGIAQLNLYIRGYKISKNFYIILYFMYSASIFYGFKYYEKIVFGILNIVLNKGFLTISVILAVFGMLYKINSKLISQIDAR